MIAIAPPLDGVVVVSRPLYAQVLGPWFHRLAPVLAWVHEAGERRLSGRLRVRVGRRPLVKALLWAARMPVSGDDVPTMIRLSPRGNAERWARRIGTRHMVSMQRYGGAGVVVEQIGPLAIHLSTRVLHKQLHQRSFRTTLFGMRLPALLGLQVVARECAVDERSFRFDVRLRSPLLGCLLHYRGVLRLETDGEGAR